MVFDVQFGYFHLTEYFLKRVLCLQDASSVPPPDELQAVADLDDTAAFVNVSEESRRKIAKIENVIGDCICALCKVEVFLIFTAY